MKRIIMTVVALAMAILVFVGCSEPTNEVPGSVKAINVRVVDATDAKTISPSGNVNISHYVITVNNDPENIHQSSGYLTKGSMFTVSNVPAGTWYAKVDGYINRGESYVKVASAQSDVKTVTSGATTTFELVLDTLDEVVSGDVTVSLVMPFELETQGTEFWYTYTIEEMGEGDDLYSFTSQLQKGTTGAEGLASITIDADLIGLMQGSYRFSIQVQDTQTAPTLTKTGVDVMRLVNGLEAVGTIDLKAYKSDESFSVSITDSIGDILTPSIKDGKEVYNLDGKSETSSLTVTLAEPLSTSQTIEWYVDGKLDETVNTDEVASGKYTLTFPNGSYIVTAIVRDTDTLMAVGSIAEFKVVVNKITFEPVEDGGEVIRFSFSQGDYVEESLYKIHVDGIFEEMKTFYSHYASYNLSGSDGRIKARINGTECNTMSYLYEADGETGISALLQSLDKNYSVALTIIGNMTGYSKDDVMINLSGELAESQFDIELELIPDEFLALVSDPHNTNDGYIGVNPGVSNWIRHNAIYDSEGNVTNIEGRMKQLGGEWIEFMGITGASNASAWIAGTGTALGVYVYGEPVFGESGAVVNRDDVYVPGSDLNTPVIVEFKRTGAAPEPVIYSAVFDKLIEDGLTGYMAHLDGLHEALLAVIEKTGVARIEVYLDGERMNIPLAADDGVGAINMSVANDAYIQNPSENLTEGQVLGSLMIFGQLGPSSPEDIVKDDVFPYVADGSAEDFSVWQGKEIEIRIY